MKDIFEVALKGAKVQAKIDRLFTELLEAGRELEKVTEAGISFGMVKPIRGKILLTQARAATGLASSAAHAFAVLHKEQTMVCAENGCDIPPVTSVGGISIMGGGDR